MALKELEVPGFPSARGRRATKPKPVAPAPVVEEPVVDEAPPVEELPMTPDALLTPPERLVAVALPMVASDDGSLPVDVRVTFRIIVPETDDGGLLTDVASFVGALGAGLEDACNDGNYLPSRWAGAVRETVRELRASGAFLRDLPPDSLSIARNPVVDETPIDPLVTPA